ncbi:putative taurine catabolism dioxygenase [Pseudomonas asplenii]|uniref:Putative taurine catabolism dioxygenase n=1 Tax=Pseudomonas asplenii TaxID=53407 RepID=A0A0N0VJF8_9PSED|nr:TauD/TfdA family dioxygenase [Pseudomonas fuscovaginae]KPA90328.1 putative taurine catabolism dioxygenase [Pseudomonas fuscovaginae]
MYSLADARRRLGVCQALMPSGVTLELLDDQAACVVVRAATANMELSALLSEVAGSLVDLVQHVGAILFRGFSVSTLDEFSAALQMFGSESLEYEERSTPRTEVGTHLYTATEYPAREPIFLHNENAYASSWPRLLGFYCEQPASSGGSMILADTRQVYAEIPASLCEACERQGLKYRRRFIEGVGYSWRQAFAVPDEEELTLLLSARGYQWFKLEDQLVVERAARWSFQHPHTHQSVWFNHGVFFNALSLPESTRQAFNQLFGPDVYPFQTLYGDGSAIEPQTYQVLREAYERALYRLALQRGDVLIIDNMLTAHGRDAYTGLRKHYVKMLA